MRLRQQMLDVGPTRINADAGVGAKPSLLREKSSFDFASQFSRYEIVAIVDVVLRSGAPLREGQRLGLGSNRPHPLESPGC